MKSAPAFRPFSIGFSGHQKSVGASVPAGFPCFLVSILRMRSGPSDPGYAISRFLTEEGAAVLEGHPVEIHTRPRAAACVCVSVSVRRHFIFESCLLIVTVFAERLPVRSVPEEFLVATVRHDVVDHRRLHIPWRYLLHAPHTKRMLREELPALLLPPASVPSCSGGRSAVTGMLLLMFFAILLPRRYKLGTARMPAGNLGLVWHRPHLHHKRPAGLSHWPSRSFANNTISHFSRDVVRDIPHHSFPNSSTCR